MRQRTQRRGADSIAYSLFCRVIAQIAGLLARCERLNGRLIGHFVAVSFELFA